MPAKNAALYIDKCIQSILNQSYLHWELIVVNDHSVDETMDYLTRFADTDQRIRVYDNKGGGIIAALRLAYAKSTGDYITRMDADDIMNENKVAALLSAVSNQKLVSTGLVTYFSDTGIGDGYQQYTTWMNTNLLSADPFSDIYKECVIPSPCWMMHRTTFDSIGAFDRDTYPEDYDLCFRMHQHGLKVNTVNDILHHWRDYPERSSRTDANYTDNRFLELKVHYFLTLEVTPKQTICLWGSGKKGKSIAKLLQQAKISFHWLTNNPKKIGHNIYEVILEGESIIEKINEAKIIIAVAGQEDQLYIKEILAEKTGLESFWFC